MGWEPEGKKEDSDSLSGYIMIHSQLGDLRELIKQMLRVPHGSIHIRLSNVWICVYKLRIVHMMIVSNRHSQEGSAGLLIQLSTSQFLQALMRNGLRCMRVLCF